ncbi:hypothetical protein BDU57DRAFT_524941 [Ampelomyces quisqualis]|uniref:Uncharacterized protein n=1 Tax=Ampelomyces quisqualis TaxID=50730 RepID=A0A6A5Q8S2_AMPQU|nr:hypothetical protein BDU57DRAFT_524941 [Ampelomyces quisqualis]
MGTLSHDGLCVHPGFQLESDLVLRGRVWNSSHSVLQFYSALFQGVVLFLYPACRTIAVCGWLKFGQHQRRLFPQRSHGVNS